MYTVIYLYQVKRDQEQLFLEINEKVSEIYLANGALEDRVYRADNLQVKHGGLGLLDLISIENHETIFFGQSVFRNKSHYEEVMTLVNNDNQIKQLSNDISACIDLSTVVSSSFSTANS
ncbi:DUF1428 family protein [Virgibacillus byunsanensis]|uniref:DUF1428 family protein n=1 Tax=Virgibacillus byunsanensis TaxID=570945 RepID=A0ABW3LSX3_9BACI